MKEYDYLIVGAGLYGAVMAHELKKKGKKCLVIDRRDHIAGNIYCEDIEGIHVHKYGAHIFHTSDKKIWDYMNQFAEFNNYINSPVAVYKDELYNLPFNMNTFSKMWNIRTPQEAKEIIENMLPVVDNFERGLAQAPEGDAFAEGMQMIYKQLMTTLEGLGVEVIEAVGKEFDPDFHNAVMHVEDEEAGENIIVEEFQKGYIYKGFVVRHSMVKVAN